MRVEVIAIGDEILSGFTVNANATRISFALSELGLCATSHRVLPDQRDQLREGLAAAIEANELVICTGGLGPTLDDNTRRAVAEVVGCGFAYDGEVAAALVKRFGGEVPALRDQATIPTAAIPLHNAVGTAPGLLFELGTCVLLLLPGVPLEMEAILEQHVRPFLAERFPRPAESARETLHFFQVRESDLDHHLRRLAAEHSDVKFGIYPGVGMVSVRMETLGAASKLRPIISCLEREFGERRFDSPSGTLEEAVLQRCLDLGATLSCAESCTGGALAARLTTIPGASRCFEGGLVTYSNALKQGLLGVSAETLERRGAVSEETVREMVAGLLERTGTRYGVAVSGIAGPDGGTPEKPVGTVWIAVGHQGASPRTRCFALRGTRNAVIAHAVSNALAELLKLLQGKRPGSTAASVSQGLS